MVITATITHRLTKQSLTSNSPTVVAVRKPDTSGVQPTVDSAARVARAPDAAAQPTAAVGRRPSATEFASNNVDAKPTAEQTYGTEIARLLVIYDKRQSQLDTTTVAVLQTNLKIIDDAIAQCRMALRKDPASRFLMQSLNDALDTKVQLLRTATMLPSRT